MEQYGIQQFIEDDLSEGKSLTEALDRAFYEMYEVFCNSIERYGSDNSFFQENDVLSKLEQCFKRKYE